ncbi:uncharacterized protein LOC105442807 [Strongylocentrotus purpuratus]|uniref:Gustatory receptor n=1 Tax=Strongylocentrotus purpuratus TaxID=7668 RepID=A0A7M7HPA5_STRPU|nr:uncharacterized protein LOC105442807 [Strongylocentrotus purpuratus]
MNTADNIRSLDSEFTTANGMTSHILEYPSLTLPSAEDDVLPLPSRLALFFLGHWFSKREKNDAKSLTKPYKEKTYGTVNKSETDEEKCVGDRWSSMDDETSLMITYDGNMDIRKDHNSIRKRLTGCCCLDVLGIVYLFLSCGMMIFDLEAYVRSYWGVKEYALHFVTYTTFIVQLMVVPFWCLYTRMKNIMTCSRIQRRVSTMSRAFIARRINVIRRGRSEAKILSWFPFLCILALPTMTGCFRILYDYFFRVCKSESIHGEVGHWNSLLGSVIYGCFCYIIYLERRSFEIEAHQIFRYAIEQAPYQNVDAVLSRIRHFSIQYKILRRQIRAWMAFTIVVSTWGLTSHITWNYLVFSQKDLPPDVLRTIYFLNALVTTQKITFIAVPYFALGGLNMDHIWRYLKEDITHCREHKYKKYWKAVIIYVKDINKMFSGILTPSIISTGLGIYLGLNLTNSQDIGFWIGPATVGCNLTNHTG